MSEELEILRRIEAGQISSEERRQLGHRIIYDKKTGWSKNIMGCHVDPSLLDDNGYQIRHGVLSIPI